MVRGKGEYCPFCSPSPESVLVYSDDLVYAMVSKSPINKFHVLVIPNGHYEQFTELPDHIAARVFLVAKRISHAVRTVCDPDAVTHLSDDDVAHAGFNLVAHYKFHVIPRYKADRVQINWNRAPDPGAEVRSAYANRLREALSATQQNRDQDS